MKDIGHLDSTGNINQLSIDQAVLEEAPLPTQMDKKASARSSGNKIMPSMLKITENSRTQKHSSIRMKEVHSQLINVRPPLMHRGELESSLEQTEAGKNVMEVPETEEAMRKTGPMKKPTPTKLLHSHMS